MIPISTLASGTARDSKRTWTFAIALLGCLVALVLLFIATSSFQSKRQRLRRQQEMRSALQTLLKAERVHHAKYFSYTDQISILPSFPKPSAGAADFYFGFNPRCLQAFGLANTATLTSDLTISPLSAQKFFALLPCATEKQFSALAIGGDKAHLDAVLLGADGSFAKIEIVRDDGGETGSELETFQAFLDSLAPR